MPAERRTFSDLPALAGRGSPSPSDNASGEAYFLRPPLIVSDSLRPQG